MKPDRAAEAHFDFERHVASHLSIHGVVAMIPYEALWAWLATELQPFATPGNLYRFWTVEKDGWHGPCRRGDLGVASLDAPADGFEWHTALDEIRSSMAREADCFRTARRRSIPPIPSRPTSRG
ncbi:MAG: hypothetical protein MI919_25895 [Holophagales bacterium]|nr:hypothetical protein [Holophagales bacterium]